MLAYQDVFLCLLSVPSSVSDQRLRAWLVQACGPHAQHGCRVAVSRTVSDARGLASTVQQALAAEAMGRRMSTWQGPLFYADMGLYRLLLGLRDQAEVRRFYSETLGRLVDYDREHNTDLVATLRAFFEQNANASETARKLFVHRNTLNYRLRRIAEIIGLDLDSADTRLALQVALRIQYLGS
jgi:purine catabolism regulator